jgi:pimeloyl-ACP methyl ester carboxylesterase
MSDKQQSRSYSHYRVISKLGEGGMGEVYLAEDTRLNRRVAIKVLPPALTRNPESVRRFMQEAQAASALNHPNIITVHDIGDADAGRFIVMELVSGKTLRSALETRPAWSTLLPWFSQMAGALAAAHAAGITHRDLKPDNVMVRDDGYVKVLDFGLARLAPAHASDDNETATRLTSAGQLMGTVKYMSPEQARGDNAGPPSDIFSLGVVFYELVTGRHPFAADTTVGYLHAITSQTPPMLGAAVPAPVATIIERMMTKDAAGRPTADEIVRALAGEPAPAPVSASREQQIRFSTTADGASVAYSTVGAGPFIVRVLGHFTHLEMEWEWPDLRDFWERLAEHHTVVRYDGRGMGLSGGYAGEFTEETRQLDLDAVLTAVGADKAVLLGISEGGWTAATYATAHPERITHLILYGAYCRGARARPDYDAEEDSALATLIRKGWGRDTPAFRQVFTSRFFRSDSDPRLIAHFNEMQRVSADPETAARYYEALHRRGDGRELFRHVAIPTLVLHSRDDQAVSAEEGRLLASLIPGAELVLLPSGSHYFPADREVIVKAAGAIARFLGC